MIVVAVLMVVGIVLATVAVLTVLRSFGQDVNRLEDELHEPGVRTLKYPVPPGRDPVDLMVAVKRAGYRGIEERPGLLLVECPHEDDAAKVRALLDSA